VEGVRAGKYIEVRLTAESFVVAEARLHSMCDQLLANAIIETYRIDVEELARV
jgi:phosphoribosylformylglycinamidine synthase